MSVKYKKYAVAACARPSIPRMISLSKDKKSPTWILTRTDSEGYHRQLNLTADELDEIVAIWTGKPQA